jgi:hypothetical protein
MSLSPHSRTRLARLCSDRTQRRFAVCLFAGTQIKERAVSAEGSALERVVNAAREVQAASQRLEAHYARAPEEQLSTLELARFAAAMQELTDAREASDALVQKSDFPPP